MRKEVRARVRNKVRVRVRNLFKPNSTLLSTSLFPLENNITHSPKRENPNIEMLEEEGVRKRLMLGLGLGLGVRVFHRFCNAPCHSNMTAHFLTLLTQS